MVAARELGGELRAFLEEAGAEPVKVGAADLEMVAGLSRVNFTLVELTEYLLEKQVGEAFADLLFLIASSQSNRCPLVEGLRWRASSTQLSPEEWSLGLRAPSFTVRE